MQASLQTNEAKKPPKAATLTNNATMLRHVSIFCPDKSGGAFKDLTIPAGMSIDLDAEQVSKLEAEAKDSPVVAGWLAPGGGLVLAKVAPPVKADAKQGETVAVARKG